MVLVLVRKSVEIWGGQWSLCWPVLRKIVCIIFSLSRGHFSKTTTSLMKFNPKISTLRKPNLWIFFRNLSVYFSSKLFGSFQNLQIVPELSWAWGILLLQTKYLLYSKYSSVICCQYSVRFEIVCCRYTTRYIDVGSILAFLILSFNFFF
jgi:hypothetical protein